MAEETESDVLQRLVPELQAEGYEVFLHPNRTLVPEFLKGYAPDILARRADKNVVIEVKRRSTNPDEKLEGLAKRFENKKDWEFRVIWIEPMSAVQTLRIQTPETVNARITEIRELTEQGYLSPALLLAWATFEAIGRTLVIQQFQRPQTPGRLVQVLATEGYLTPTEADTLRVLAEKRNRLIHGELDTGASTDDMRRFAEILDTLLSSV